MSYSLYKIYLENTINLARSMVVKLDFIGIAMNRKLTDFGVAVPSDRREWRYYLHLSGNYHFQDEEMVIKSLDDSTDIVFNRENLKRHKKTRSVYLYDKAYADALKVKYPEQTVLINGILRPVDLEVAVNAPNGTVLGYNTNLVDKQEYELIPKLERFVRGFLHRYDLQSLQESDELTPVDIAGKLFAFIAVRLLDIRNSAVRSSQTHSFHIMAFLASNQRLDEFVPYLNHDQLLFLYRNIMYIKQHTGMQHTFDKLVQRLLTERNLPLYDYTLRQKDMDIENDVLDPYPIFAKNQLNLKTGLSSRDLDEWEIDEVMRKEIPLGSDNDKFYESYYNEASEHASISSISHLPTKILEVSAVDPEDIDPIKLIDVLINEWMHQAAIGMYATRLEVLNPLNGDIIQLDTGQMFLLYIYAHAAGYHGIEMDEIPVFIAKSVLQKRWIDESEYLSIVRKVNFNEWDDEIEFFTSTQPIVFDEPMTSDDFLTQANHLLKVQRVRHQFAFQPHRFTERQARRSMYHYAYKDYECDFREEFIQTYDDFFTYIALDKEVMSQEAWKDLAMECLNTATNYGSMNLISLREVQSAMVRLFRRLSSYSIQFIEEIVGGEIISTDPLAACLGDTEESVEGDANVHGLHTTIIATKGESVGDGDSKRKATEAKFVSEEIKRYLNPKIHVRAKADEVTELISRVRKPRCSVRSFTVEPLS